MLQERLARERDFHNERFSHASDPREHLDKWYASARHGAQWQEEMVLDLAADRDVLEYGCADGSLSLGQLELPARCRSLTGIDISDVAIAKATRAAAAAGVGNARFLVMDAEAMTFADRSFDLVFGRGILHHLNLENCFSEIARILRDGGVAIFSEPMGHNPLINLYRARTPEIRTEDEHPMVTRDFALARRHFSQVEGRFYGLFSVASVLLDRTANGAPYRLGKAIDDVVLRVPAFGRYAWHCLIILRKRS